MIRSPGTSLRVLFVLLALGAGWVLLLLGFPPGAPDRLPVLLLGVSLAVVCAARPARGLIAFSFLFPCAGILARLFHGTDAAAWTPILLASVAAGWSFRFIYDFESPAEPARPDPLLKALLIVWILSTLLAIGRAKTLWAIVRGLSGRAVNGDGLLDGSAVAESVFAFAALAGGAVFYLILRRSGEAIRQRALDAALIGTAVSALASVLQWLSWLPSETRGFWALTRRLAGGAADPNSLGLLCGLSLVLALVRAAGRMRTKAANAGLLAVLLAGLVFSGSRSGLLLLLFSLAILLATSRSATAVRRGIAAVATVVLLALALIPFRAAPGTLGGRIADSFDPTLPTEFRVSARPALWRAAAELFFQHPIEGAGMGVYKWTLPDLLRRQNRRLPLRDNPGSGYMQALAETGAIGFVLTVALAGRLFAQGVRRSREGSDPLRAGAGISVAAFVLALAAGSHWLAPDVALLFFLLASVAVFPGGGKPPGRRAATGRAIAVGGYALAAAVGLAATLRARETFRFAPEIGFHPAEADPEGRFRWTRGRFAVWVDAGGGRRIRLVNQAPIPGPLHVSVRSEGAELRHLALPPGARADLRLHAAPTRGAAFVFRLDRTFIPRRYGPSSDRRELGVVEREP
jgi:O-antigen ligase